MNPREFTDRYNELTGMFLRKFGEGMGDGNILFSPFSILSMLSILADATAGTTRQEILNLLYGSLPQKGFPEQLQSARKELIRKEEHYYDYDDPYFGKPIRDMSEHFHSSNAVCVREDIRDSIHPGFRKHLREMYDGQLIDSPDLSEALRSWLDVRRGMENLDNIREMLLLLEETVRSDSLLTMINTVLFDAMWQHPYKDKDIEDGVFHNADGTDSTATMLHGGSNCYVENEYGAGFIKEFQQCGYSFMALLPKEKGPECLKALAVHTDFYDLLHHQKRAIVYTMMPEFSVSFDETLNGMVRSLGIREAFTDRADFSSISTVPLRVDRMIHQARIKVDRNGARAAAATMIVLLTGLPPEEKKYILIDRPFVFAIVHEKLGIPVFAGVVNRIDNTEDSL